MMYPISVLILYITMIAPTVSRLQQRTVRAEYKNKSHFFIFCSGFKNKN